MATNSRGKSGGSVVIAGVLVSFDSGHGKGSHGRLYYGERFTTLKDRRKEIGPGLLKAMLDQLGLTRKDLENR
jgi:mRNA interferase HicA